MRLEPWHVRSKGLQSIPLMDWLNNRDTLAWRLPNEQTSWRRDRWTEICCDEIKSKWTSNFYCQKSSPGKFHFFLHSLDLRQIGQLACKWVPRQIKQSLRDSCVVCGSRGVIKWIEATVWLRGHFHCSCEPRQSRHLNREHSIFNIFCIVHW